MSIPTVIIGGFLGSGKTTLLNSIFRQLDPEKSVALIINEFGDISIDGELVENGSYSKMEITGGCICCSLKDKLIEGIRGILVNEKPDLIYIEATGLAVPREMKREIEKYIPEDIVTVENILITVDSEQFNKCHGNLLIYDRQFEGSPKILLTKSDIYQEDLISSVRTSIGTIYDDIHHIDESCNPSGRFIDCVPEYFRLPGGAGEDTAQFTIDKEQFSDIDKIAGLCIQYSSKIIRMKAILTRGGIATVIQFDGKNLFQSEKGSEYKGESSKIIGFCPVTEKEKLQKIFDQ